ncbi:MAG: hypothetical protein QF659_03735 [Dehalococcoidia bacterium]|jgi:hypothetical protein|nr:hypothetical protein [Dehalococcoidia bacterium]
MPHEGRRQKQVSLTVFDNEPMARLAEQRLQQAGIRCIIRSLRGGPGVWGSAYNLPHDVCVYEADQLQAREVLDLGPQEMGERDRHGAAGSRPALWLVAAGIIIAALVLGIVVPLLTGSDG